MKPPNRATWAGLSPFERILQVVACVPPGRVATYGQIAMIASGTSRGARMVGWALHGLSAAQAEYVPWWRIVNAGGRISTTCREHAARVQRERLEAEGVVFGLDGGIALEEFRWPVSSEGMFLYGAIGITGRSDPVG